MTPLSDACRAARRALLAREDGASAAAEREALARHLAECDACRRRADELARTMGALRSLPPALPFPDDALETLWNRTVRAAPEPARVPDPGRPARLARRAAPRAAPSATAAWLLALAATVLLAAVLGPYLAFRARERAAPAAQSAAAALGPEERRAAADLRLVLQLTDRALQRSQRAAVDGVLRRGVDPALRRVPVLREIIPVRPSSRDGSVETVR